MAQKKYQHLYVFGDSYSTTDYAVPWRASFWGLAAQRLGVQQITNFSRLGSSLDIMTHWISCEHNRIQWRSDSLVLFCVGPLERITWHDMTSQNVHDVTIIDVMNDSIRIELLAGHQGLITDPNYHILPEIARIEERSWTECNGLRNLFMLYHYLSAQKTPFMILNMCYNYIRRPGWPTDFFADWFSNKHNVVMFENTYASINKHVNRPVDFNEYGWQGHHGPEGNRHFFENSFWPAMLAAGLA